MPEKVLLDHLERLFGTKNVHFGTQIAQVNARMDIFGAEKAFKVVGKDLPGHLERGAVKERCKCPRRSFPPT